MASCKRVSVTVRKGENFTRAWKRFEKMCDDAEIVNDFKDHEFFEKNSLKKKRKRSFAVARERRRQMEDQQ